MNGGTVACPVLRSKAHFLHWDTVVKSDVELGQLIAALQEQFAIAKEEGMVLKVDVLQADVENM